ncbi:hypothetical protein SAMN04487910_4074 [Aquimarina amphilecti]|uniref:SnoaL-like domain-containing protein n=1 Tax=Aquimarina amphilecti TaxID=1038014 RepID=A0A1H7VEV9_AQUAM|nr:hypothetical protein [Aquimarina amphilecti]SEM07782.1 hypothetical protein SAMN04487910_4074 [Aquimarina amphilecti]
MSNKTLSIFALTLLLIIISCKKIETPTPTQTSEQTVNIEEEKKAILEALNSETKAAFERDYEGWKEKWLHDPNITKTYINFADSTFSESVGWDKISLFVKTFIEEHPEPEPIPKLLKEIDLRLYGKGAWVTYELKDSIRGLKRETRLMEKINGSWKIAGMQTTIYGFETDKN